MPWALGNGKAQVSNTFVTLSASRALKTEELLLAVKSKENRRLNSYELSCNSLLCVSAEPVGCRTDSPAFARRAKKDLLLHALIFTADPSLLP